jgi:dTDP-4-dehydrorhamnose reductase
MMLIVGGDSEIGAATYRAARERGKPVAATTRRPESVAPERPFLDLSASLDRWQPPSGTTSACICAAVARLATCAADPEGTARINVVQTGALIEKLLARGIYVLFLSTNQVFDGREPHVPADAPSAPLSAYGRQKARTEAVLRGHMTQGAPVGILRLAKIVSATTPLLSGWITDLSAGKPIRAFCDMTVSPTPMHLVCAAIASLLRDRATGTFQLTGPRDVTYAEIGRLLAAQLGANRALVTETSVREAALPEGAAPPYTTLDSSLLRLRYGLEALDVRQVVEWLAATAIARSPTSGNA